MTFNTEERHLLDEWLLTNNRSVILTSEENDNFQNVATKFRKTLSKMESNGPTAKLWVQYFRMVTLIKQFIKAERSGNWVLHLTTIQKMLPFFHASGHIFYAKCAQLYIQDMLTLKDRMDPLEYNKFTSEGYFTIRWTSKFWSGIWSDMTIEQTLMKTIKSSGGLTRGRGIIDTVFLLIIVGEDIDLLVFLTGLVKCETNVYFKKCGRAKTQDVFYSSTSLNVPSLSHLILVVHAFTGYDTTSCMYGHGKNKILSLVQKQPQLQKAATTFLNSNATPKQVAAVGEQLLVATYGGQVKEHLNDLRYKLFVRSTKSTFHLARLPPTQDAARLHSLRTYHQVMYITCLMFDLCFILTMYRK
ncbi:hypothetical protein RN001_004306 [Aquatica leii]|uniref:Uncharacterized protein n=1 Tax=Aquatica leii TaxID=1421715 RepID=A0AAN7PZS5_9COLE|nr:hypothetical protein RN001_004306 [Aquatica leii]